MEAAQVSAVSLEDAPYGSSFAGPGRPAVTCLAWAINASTTAVSAYGGLATTRKGRPGGTKSTRSHSTTEAAWSLTFSRNRRARPAWSSTAMTRAPASSNGRVRAPTPAPRSTTSSPWRMAALATIRSAQSGSSRCQPHGRRPDTTHHEDHRHDPKPSGPASPPRGNFQPRPAEDDHRGQSRPTALGHLSERHPRERFGEAGQQAQKPKMLETSAMTTRPCRPGRPRRCYACWPGLPEPSPAKTSAQTYSRDPLKMITEAVATNRTRPQV